MGIKLLLIPALLILALILSASLIYAQNEINIKFVTHPQAGFPEQDVYILQGTQVVRVEAKDATSSATLSKTVYTSSEAQAHDPFKLGQNPLGPFPKGKALGFTMKDWLEATGEGTYTIDKDSAHLGLTFHKLVPSSTYTVWCSRLTFPPNFKVVDRPCGKEDGSENIFKSDSIGQGGYSLSLKPLESSDNETATAIAVAYHSDGKTYGASPGEFGKTTHVQLFMVIPPTPAMSREVTPVPSATPIAAPSLLMSKKFWAGIIGVIVILLTILWWVSRKSPNQTSEN